MDEYPKADVPLPGSLMWSSGEYEHLKPQYDRLKAKEHDMTKIQADQMAFDVAQLLTDAQRKLEQLRDGAGFNGLNGRALSVAITELETASLWVARAVYPDPGHAAV